MKFYIIYILAFVCQLLLAQKKMTPEEYIEKYKEDAVKEMYLAQGMLESGNGNSALCRNANNHFGIKCHNEWAGETYIMDDDSANECFRKYENVLDSYSDHGLFLYSRSRYAKLFELPINDYKGWCYGLKAAGYATDPKYPERLIDIIERYKLQEYNVFENTPKHDFPSHGSMANSNMAIREVYRFNHIRFVIAGADDSFYKIASDFDLELDDLMRFNDFSKTDKISYGQKIYIQKKRRRALEPMHVVQKNETLKSIAQLHGIQLKMICKKNRIKPDAKLKIGDVLYLRQKIKAK
jgi:LysM repeat protein